MWSNINVWWAPDYYRSPTMLREGNVFTDVCVSICSQGAGSLCDHYPWYIGHHCKSPPNPLDIRPGTPPPPRHQALIPSPLLVTSGGYHWRPVQTCSFDNTPDRHLVVATEACTVCKRAVRILLEYFLVYGQRLKWEALWLKCDEEKGYVFHSFWTAHSSFCISI